MIELDFIGAYEVGPTGFKIGSFLEEFGFVLVGNYNTQYRSSARLCPSRHAYSERLFWSDAIFVKDELVFRNSANTDTLAGSQLALGQGLVIAASYLGFHDYALETLDQLPPSPINTALKAAIMDAATPVLDKDLSIDVKNLLTVISTESADIRTELGRFVEKYRFHGNFNKITKF